MVKGRTPVSRTNKFSIGSNSSSTKNSLGHTVSKKAKKVAIKEHLKQKRDPTKTVPKQQLPLAAPGAACSVKELIAAAIQGTNGNNNQQQQQNSGRNNNNNNKKNNSKNTNSNKNNSFNNNNVVDPLDPFSSVSAPKNSNNKQKQKNSENDDNHANTNYYQSPDDLLSEGNQFFVKRNKEERELTKAALKRIEEMKRINDKGGDGNGFKFIIPRSAKKLASRMAGDVEITLDDRKAVAGRLLPSTLSSATTNGDGADAEDITGGLNDDDRPMRKKKPRAAKELKDFYTWQKWKNWTRNAEDFLSRGKLSRKVFDTKRKFKSV